MSKDSDDLRDEIIGVIAEGITDEQKEALGYSSSYRATMSLVAQEFDIDQIMKLVEALIEREKQQAKRKEIQWFIDELWSDNVKPDEIYPKLQARIAILTQEEVDD